MATRTIAINGTRVVFEDEGRGDPLVLLHGSMSSASYWDVVVPSLLVDHRCVRLEFPGHGRSDRSPMAAYSVEDQIDVTIQFLEAVTGESIVIGASAGAGTAFGAASRRPDLVKGIYSDDAYPGIYTAGWIASSSFIGLFHVVGSVLRSMPTGFSVSEYAAVLGQARLGHATMLDLLGPANVAFLARVSAETDPAFFDVVTNPDRYWTTDQVAAVVQGVRCPVHVAYGDLDCGSLVPLAEIDALEIAGVEVSRTHFPGAGHMISPLYPVESIADIRAFVAGISSRI